MKKIILSSVLLTFMILGIMSIANATVVHFYINITINDTCNGGGYKGYYCAQWKIVYNGISDICTTTKCTLVGGTQQVTFDCNLEDYIVDCYYGIQMITVCRYPSNTCCSSSFSPCGGTRCWRYLTHGSYTYSCSVTI